MVDALVLRSSRGLANAECTEVRHVECSTSRSQDRVARRAAIPRNVWKPQQLEIHGAHPEWIARRRMDRPRPQYVVAVRAPVGVWHSDDRLFLLRRARRIQAASTGPSGGNAAVPDRARVHVEFS